ncbi:acyl-CoA dehydrogenase family protein [Pelagibacterium limicola]|uniref:acyl-CoA dehydrogenase family protein n=1 Tax=Pelagibacterium limicola TaxID=2791022 RepID=UPI0018AFB731|nr:acyl-CoA dehydrogenase family protein [Pelagibacterium limicola]
MAEPGASDPFAVYNQPPLRDGIDLWHADPLLRSGVAAFSPDFAPGVMGFAATLGQPGTVAAGHSLATSQRPVLQRFDTGGRRIETVAYPDAYHAFMTTGMGAGYAALPWTASESGHAAHAAMVYLMSQVEPGVCCPMTMTYAAVPALLKGEGLAADLARRAMSARYDPADVPVPQKQGATIGMAMTEKQGGSDVRANLAQAEPGDGGFFLFGHKWFCSAPMSDAFLTLARRPEGLSCFVVPRRLPDGTLNAIHLMRLKDKLGNRANASAEIEYHGAYAQMLGEPGDGIRTILEMVHHTRLDTSIAPAGLMRRALVEAHYWARHRSVFGAPLIDQPLMRNVLADLTLEWASAFLLAMRVARAFDAAGRDPGEHAFARLAVALAKYSNNKACPAVVCEAMECLGGMGYVEDTPVPWLYREAPLNAIWEGSGNVVCLDVLRTLSRLPRSAEILLTELESARGAHPDFDTALVALKDRLVSPIAEADARYLTGQMALLLATALMIEHHPGPIAETFAATRLGNAKGPTLGAFSRTVPVDAILTIVEAG